MSLFDIFILGLVLGVDCLVISFTQGICMCCKCKKISLRIAFTMGLFQGLMPFISYCLTNFVYEWIEPISKPVIFGIFLFLGLKFILEAFEKEKKVLTYKCNWNWFLLLGLLTSIDALGAGVLIKLTSTNILTASSIIGITSFLMSILGFVLSNCFSSIKTKYLNILAGTILILLAVKTFFF